MRKTATFQLSEPVDQVREHLLGGWGESMVRLGLGPSGHGEAGCNYRGRYRPWWIYAVCILLFPIGLLALLYGHNHDVVQVELFEAGDGGTRVEAVGTARRKVWRTVERWRSAATPF